MDRLDRIINIGGAILFGGIALGCLAGVIFHGAIHQLVDVGIGGVMAVVLYAEVRQDRKKSVEEQPNN